MHRKLLILVATVALAAGCSFSASIGNKKVSSAELEKQVALQAADNNLTTTSVDCPAGLEATVGAVAQCEMIANDLKYTATVKATSIDGDTVNFDLDVPPPAIVPLATLEDEVASIVGDQAPGGVASVDCADELVGTNGETVVCAVEAGSGETRDVVVTVTKADFFNVNFSVDFK